MSFARSDALLTPRLFDSAGVGTARDLIRYREISAREWASGSDFRRRDTRRNPRLWTLSSRQRSKVVRRVVADVDSRVPLLHCAPFAVRTCAESSRRCVLGHHAFRRGAHASYLPRGRENGFGEFGANLDRVSPYQSVQMLVERQGVPKSRPQR